MADPTRRYTNNVPGKFYVDEECIDCSLCSEIAPDNFTIHLEEGHDYVYKQPANEREESLCLEAMDSCPVAAIGADGQSV